MDMSICRESVCMADDVDSHTRTYTIEPTTTFIDIFLDLIKQKYFPSVFGNDVVWTLFCGDDDLKQKKINYIIVLLTRNRLSLVQKGGQPLGI